MPQLPPAAQTLGRALRRVAPLALGGRGLRTLSLGAPRYRQAREPGAVGEVALLLRSHRRRLWRRRASLVLARCAGIGLAAQVAVNLLSLLLGLDLAPLRWLPLALCLPAGLILAVGQRPTVADTARLLDRRYGLQEQLGTALEIAAAGALPPLQARQLAQAQAVALQLPDHAWEAGTLHWVERWTLVALVAGALTSLFAVQRAADQPLAHAASTISRPGATAPLAPLHGGLAAHAALPSAGVPVSRPGTAPVVPAASSFNASLQIRTGPSVGGGAPISGAGAAPQLLQATLGGQSSGVGGRNPAAVGPGGAPAPNGSGGAHSGFKGSSDGAASSQPKGGSNRSGAGNGQQGGSSSQQGNGGQQGSQAGQAPGKLGPAQGSQPSGDSGGQGQAPGGPQGANPFGQDPQPANQSGSPSGRGAPSGRQARPGRSTAAPGSSQSSPDSRRGASPGGPDDNLMRHGRGVGAATTGKQPVARHGQAGPAHGGQLDLGGHFIMSTGVAGAQTVRVMPRSAGGGPGMGDSGQTGPGTVQGYVPEDDANLSLAEQALVRAYFNGGSGG